MQKPMKPSNKLLKAIKHSGGLLTLCLLLSCTSLSAQEKQRTTPTTDRQNTYTDQQWTQEAFNEHLSMSGAYPNWLDSDSLLTRETFNTGLFSRWDSDEDGYISKEEYVAGSTAWGGEYTENFPAWDTDEDGQLDDNEFAAGMDETGLYDSWDVDGEGYLTEQEFSDGLFNTLDANEDGYLTDGEFEGNSYDTWFNADTDGGGTGTDIDPGGGTGSGIDGGTDIDTGTGTGTGTGTDIGTGGGTGTDSGGATGTGIDIDK